MVLFAAMVSVLVGLCPVEPVGMRCSQRAEPRIQQPRKGLASLLEPARVKEGAYAILRIWLCVKNDQFFKSEHYHPMFDLC